MLLVHLQMNFLILSLIKRLFKFFGPFKKINFKIIGDSYTIVKHNTEKSRLFLYSVPWMVTTSVTIVHYHNQEIFSTQGVCWASSLSLMVCWAWKLSQGSKVGQSQVSPYVPYLMDHFASLPDSQCLKNPLFHLFYPFSCILFHLFWFC